MRLRGSNNTASSVIGKVETHRDRILKCTRLKALLILQACGRPDAVSIRPSTRCTMSWCVPSFMFMQSPNIAILWEGYCALPFFRRLKKLLNPKNTQNSNIAQPTGQHICVRFQHARVLFDYHITDARALSYYRRAT